MARVYVAGPCTQGDVALNVRRAIEAGHLLMEAGHIPFIPHLDTHFWHMLYPREYEEWLEYNEHWVPLCHVILRLNGASSGADREVAQARRLQMPIFYEVCPLEKTIESITAYQEVTKLR